MADWPCAEANRARRKPKYVDSNDEDEDYEESATGEALVLDDQAVRVIIGIEQQPTDQNQPAQQTDFKDPMDGDRRTCGKKRCADRYDSSESSDSGVVVSCGECSSSGTSDITEPGSPYSTSSDEGVGSRSSAPSPLPSLACKLAPQTPPAHSGTRPQWPWTPPLATTACSAFKRLKVEPEAATLPRSGATDPTQRQTSKPAPHHHHHPHDSQGKITEYFKTQIKPQQQKAKKSSEMSVMVAKSSTTEFLRPATVQHNNKVGLAKYLGAMVPNDWPLSVSKTVVPSNLSPLVLIPRTTAKIEKKTLKVSTTSLPPANNTKKRLENNSEVVAQPVVDFQDKPIVNENNNLPNGVSVQANARTPVGLLDNLFRRVPEEESPVPKEVEEDEDEDDDEEDSRDSNESKTPPILSTPTTIRFPKQDRGKDTSDSGVCRWDKCETNFECSGSLLEHLQTAHINSQTGGDNFVCHWQGCKVQGRTSCSRRWLERHVMSHGGNKPFRCIVDNCGSRFSSQTALERHVNNHFNQSETSSSSSKRSCENGVKLVRRNGKRLRYRRQPWSARLFDYFDSGVMEGLQHRLIKLSALRTNGLVAETPVDSMTLTSQVIGRRIGGDGKTEVLMRYYPQFIEDDEWVLESEAKSVKFVNVSRAAANAPNDVSALLYPAMKGGEPTQNRRKQHRKVKSCT